MQSINDNIVNNYNNDILELNYNINDDIMMEDNGYVSDDNEYNNDGINNFNDDNNYHHMHTSKMTSGNFLK
ncbi:hypothetical protein LbFV_ORF93 [Leptopilina boulardi filamentous virus]|uniref:Uncharacterized protein n=1 Tax=Leptopilina boulardi filamentous virus TaxID=552509 RepID=A0A1S5YD40_9VIRU|nr:hypothetical protein LbFV_ORF93 [Leptopilina boulardi filamentous virus]AQQ80013.1 hypothetical protein LbFV_ORF93 [Leptopilina boulardi filamentous virus]